MSTWDAALQIKAWRKGHALPKTSHLHLAFNDNFWVCCPLAMAGEDPSLHAVLLGDAKSQGQLLAAPDPRSLRHRLEFFSRLRRNFDEYFQACLNREDDFPQLLVPSQSAAKVLVGLADYLSYLQEPKEGGKQLKGWTQDARELGRLWQLYAARLEIPGQQILLSAYELLDQHWAFGQDLQGHLGAQLVWLDPPQGQNLMLAAAAAETQPMGAKTDAYMDQKELAPALEAWAKVERSSSSSLASFRRQEIEDMLQKVLRPIWNSTLQAKSYSDDWPILEGIDELRQREREAFEYHMTHLSNDGKFSRSDSPMRAIYSLAEREDAAEQYQAAAVWGDRMHREKACLDGDILRGRVEHLPTDHGNNLVVISTQRWLRIRRGDELVLMDGEDRIAAVVENLVRRGNETRVLLHTNSTRTIPAVGQITDWSGSAPDWYRIHSERGKIARNLGELPVTHQTAPEAAKAPKAPTWDGNNDPLAAIEDMR